MTNKNLLNHKLLTISQLALIAGVFALPGYVSAQDASATLEKAPAVSITTTDKKELVTTGTLKETPSARRTRIVTDGKSRGTATSRPFEPARSSPIDPASRVLLPVRCADNGGPIGGGGGTGGAVFPGDCQGGDSGDVTGTWILDGFKIPYLVKQSGTVQQIVFKEPQAQAMLIWSLYRSVAKGQVEWQPAAKPTERSLKAKKDNTKEEKKRKIPESKRHILTIDDIRRNEEFIEGLQSLMQQHFAGGRQTIAKKETGFAREIYEIELGSGSITATNTGTVTLTSGISNIGSYVTATPNLMPSINSLIAQVDPEAAATPVEQLTRLIASATPSISPEQLAELQRQADTARLSLQGSLSAAMNHGNCLISFNDVWAAEASTSLGGNYNVSGDTKTTTLRGALDFNTSYGWMCASFEGDGSKELSRRSDGLTADNEVDVRQLTGTASVKLGLLRGESKKQTAYFTQWYTVYTYLSYGRARSDTDDTSNNSTTTIDATAWQAAGGLGMQARGKICGVYDLNAGVYRGSSEATASNDASRNSSGNTSGGTYSFTVDCPLEKYPLYWNGKVRYDSDSEFDSLNYGLGVGYNITDNMRFEIDWERSKVSNVTNRVVNANFIYDFYRSK